MTRVAPEDSNSAGWFADFAKQFDGRTSGHRLPTQMIYCVTEGIGMPAKIGSTQNLKMRMSQYQVHTWRPMFICWTAPGGLHMEWALKHVLQGDVHKGEWINDPNDMLKMAIPFNGTDEQVIGLINRLGTERGVSPLPPEAAARKAASQMKSFRDAFTRPTTTTAHGMSPPAAPVTSEV